MNYRKNCFTYWFPKLSRQEVNLPGTLVFNTDKLDKNITVALRKAFWMKPLTKEDKVSLGRFASILKHMAKTIGGYPFFLRTGQTSHKHDWMQTCYIANEEALLKTPKT